jgi:hypothetical protein
MKWAYIKCKKLEWAAQGGFTRLYSDFKTESKRSKQSDEYNDDFLSPGSHKKSRQISEFDSNSSDIVTCSR